MRKKIKIFVAMSGGVDSSVAAMILKNRGYEVTGVFMRCYNVDGCAERDAEDARRTAAYLKIPFYIFDFESEYKRKVVNYMIDGYKKGITPNPDVMCNKEIKFGLFFKKALSLGADYVATGHYARLVKNSLFEAKDKNKDQSYFLWTLTQRELRRCFLPIGDYLKSEVRKMARRNVLPTAEKKDSQGICFLGKVSLLDFLKDYIPEEKGEVLTTAGKKIGKHKGAQFYTIGQRHIGVASRGPVYVVKKDLKSNVLIVAEGKKNPVLYEKEVNLKNVNFLRLTTKNKTTATVYARLRYRQPLARAKLARNYKSSVISHKLIFERAQKFVAPGQSAVFYGKNGEMLGGGIIV